MKKIFLIFSLLFFCFGLFSQTDSLLVFEKNIKQLFDKIQISTSNQDLKEFSKDIEIELLKALNIKASYEYPFDSLNFLGKIYSEDKLLRIYSWNIPFSDGTFTYGCVLQQKENNKVTCFKIKKAPYKPALERTISSSDWYGALYYKAIPIKQRKKSTYYILLGWAGYNDLTTLKLIDVLTINKNNLSLGMPILEKENKMYSRYVFEYGAQYRMTLDYDKKTKQIIFDHLAPSSPKYEGIFSDYGPDFTYDSFVLKRKKWSFKQNIDARNNE